MTVTFNGDVTINGNMEIFENGSVKITGNQINISVDSLSDYIEENLKNSSNKKEYLEMAEVFKDEKDKGKIKKALESFRKMYNEIKKPLIINGLSTLVLEVAKNL